MNCNKACEVISDYISGHLPHDVRRRYEAHVGECMECAGELDEMRAIIGSLKSLGDCSMPVDCWPAIRARVEDHARARPVWPRLLRPIVAAPAFAVALLVAAVMIFTGPVSEPPGQSPASMPEYGHYITAHAGVQREQAFSDPDVTFVAADLEKASLTGAPGKP
jgi:hypothetical protein